MNFVWTGILLELGRALIQKMNGAQTGQKVRRKKKPVKESSKTGQPDPLNTD